MIFSLIFPNNLNCIICNMPISKKNKYSLCRYCYEKIYFINNGCGKCGKPLINLDEELEIDNCGFCKTKNFLFDRNISTLEYNEETKSIIFGLKYRNKTFLSKNIAEMMYDSLVKNHIDILKRGDIITFVPISKNRLKKRGFNQAEKICKYLLDNLKRDESFKDIGELKLLDCLERNADTKKLSELKAKNRKNELKGVFSVKDEYKDDIKNKNIILVDDIFTTGATVNEITKVLKVKGANQVIVLTFLTGKYEKDIKTT